MKRKIEYKEKELTVKQYLQNEGIGSGTNITTGLLASMLKEYGRTKCDEQRRLCAETCEILEPNYNDVLTATSPEF